ncbi:MAG: cytochrome c [Nitrospirae bacterium]|nr:MAG: cytochrome c [Nitrospirota bacterium]
MTQRFWKRLSSAVMSPCSPMQGWSVNRGVGILVIGLLLVCSGALAKAGEMDPLKPRVPPREQAKVHNWHPSYGSTRTAPPEVIAQGKRLYETVGLCAACHGKSGKGDGPAGKPLRIGPRDFTNCRFHQVRTDGELFWILKNGSPGTGMMPMVKPKGHLTEEQGWAILAYERQFCKETSL